MMVNAKQGAEAKKGENDESGDNDDSDMTATSASRSSVS